MNLLISSVLVGATATAPFLVGYQTAVLEDVRGDASGTLFVAIYDQVNESELSLQERAALHDLLERVETHYGDADRRGRALMTQEYLEYVDSGAGVKCSELVLKLHHYTGVRYRVCTSPNLDVIRLLEDLSTPQRVFWRIRNPDPQVQQRIDEIFESAMMDSDPSSNDPERIAEIQAEVQSKIEKLNEELGPSASAYEVHELEVNGEWRDVTVRDISEYEEVLLTVGTAGSGDFSSRTSQVLCLLRSIQQGKLSVLDDVVAGGWRLAPIGLESDAVGRALSCDAEALNLSVTGGSVDGPLSLQFFPVPDAVAEDHCADGEWDPPKPTLSFDQRVDRLRSGRGW